MTKAKKRTRHPPRRKECLPPLFITLSKDEEDDIIERAELYSYTVIPESSHYIMPEELFKLRKVFHPINSQNTSTHFKNKNASSLSQLQCCTKFPKSHRILVDKSVETDDHKYTTKVEGNVEIKNKSMAPKLEKSYSLLYGHGTNKRRREYSANGNSANMEKIKSDSSYSLTTPTTVDLAKECLGLSCCEFMNLGKKVRANETSVDVNNNLINDYVLDKDKSKTKTLIKHNNTNDLCIKSQHRAEGFISDLYEGEIAIRKKPQTSSKDQQMNNMLDYSPDQSSCKSKNWCFVNKSKKHNQKDTALILPEGTLLLKPDKKLVELVARAIVGSPDGILQVQQIYSVLQNKFPFYSFLDKSSLNSWRSSVRHALYQKWFRKVKIQNDEHPSSKGCFWTINRAFQPKEWQMPNTNTEARCPFHWSMTWEPEVDLQDKDVSIDASTRHSAETDVDEKMASVDTRPLTPTYDIDPILTSSITPGSSQTLEDIFKLKTPSATSILPSSSSDLHLPPSQSDLDLVIWDDIPNLHQSLIF